MGLELVNISKDCGVNPGWVSMFYFVCTQTIKTLISDTSKLTYT